MFISRNPQYGKPFVRVLLDNGAMIDVAPDHVCTTISELLDDGHDVVSIQPFIGCRPILTLKAA